MAVELVEAGSFIGFVGLAETRFEAHFTPAVEVGWRLARDYWGCGYASEGARAAIAFGFDQLGPGEVVSFTTVGNERSRKVMERLGMTRDPGDDFDHPLLAHADPLRPHVLYRLRRATS
jgi:RimJ/RimL family protein N-acetyltransferase